MICSAEADRGVRVGAHGEAQLVGRRARGAARGPDVAATTRAERLPSEPPETKQPPSPSGSPAAPARKCRTWFSAATAPAASSQEVPLSDEARDDHVEEQRGLGRGVRDEGEERRAVDGDDVQREGAS